MVHSQISPFLKRMSFMAAYFSTVSNQNLHIALGIISNICLSTTVPPSLFCHNFPPTLYLKHFKPIGKL